MVRKKESTSVFANPHSLQNCAINSVSQTFPKDRQTIITEVLSIVSARNLEEENTPSRNALNHAILKITDQYAQFRQNRSFQTKDPDSTIDFDAQDVFITLRQPARQALGELYLNQPLTRTNYRKIRELLRNFVHWNEQFGTDDGKDVRNLYLIKCTWAMGLTPAKSLKLLEEAIREYQQADPQKRPYTTNGSSEFGRRYPTVDFLNNLSVGKALAASCCVILGNNTQAETLLAEGRSNLVNSLKYLGQPNDHGGPDYHQRLATAYINQVLIDLIQTHLNLSTRGQVEQSVLDEIYLNLYRTTGLLYQDENTINNGGDKLREYILPALTTRFLHSLHLLQYTHGFSLDKFITLANKSGYTGSSLPDLIASVTSQAQTFNDDAENNAELKHLSYIIKHLSQLASPPTSPRVDLD